MHKETQTMDSTIFTCEICDTLFWTSVRITQVRVQIALREMGLGIKSNILELELIARTSSQSYKSTILTT